MKYLTIIAMTFAFITIAHAEEQQPKLLKKIIKHAKPENLQKLADDIATCEDLSDSQKECLIEVLNAVQE